MKFHLYAENCLGQRFYVRAFRDAGHITFTGDIAKAKPFSQERGAHWQKHLSTQTEKLHLEVRS